MGRKSRFTRRRLLEAAGVSLPGLIPAGVLASAETQGAGERLIVAVIGVGGMGTVHLNNMIELAKEDKVGIAAVCDADERRLQTAVKAAGKGVEPYRDYRYVLQRNDIDAVVIATPDHWHAVQTVHACESGKHVYVEKPASCTVEEGKAMVAAARKNRRAVQVGAQGRNGLAAWYTCRAVRNGMIGKVSKVTC
jgi:predicted dehydrogenase